MAPLRVSSRTLLPVILAMFLGVTSWPGWAQEDPPPTENNRSRLPVNIAEGSGDEKVMIQGGVINLGPRTDGAGHRAMAAAFGNIVVDESSLGQGQEHKIVFRIEDLVGELLHAQVGDVVVGADLDCKIFRIRCGLMAKITETPKFIACRNKQACLEVHFRDVGLEQVIESGTLLVEARIDVTSEDPCFRDFHVGEEFDSLEAASLEGCSTRSAGALPPRGPLPTGGDATAHTAPAGHLIAVQTGAESCDAANHLRYASSLKTTKSISFPGGLKGVFKYRGTLGFDYTLKFEGGSLKSVQAKLVSCQAGHMGLTGTASRNDTVALWVRSTQPQVVWVGWVPIMYTLTARLDASASAQAGFGKPDLFSLRTTVRCSAAWPINNGAGWRLCAGGSTGRWPPDLSVANDIGVDGRATAALIPALQINVYGVGGPRLSGSIEATAIVDANKITGKLTGSLKPELDSRLLDDPIVFDTYRIFGCVLNTGNLTCDTAWNGVSQTTAFDGLAWR